MRNFEFRVVEFREENLGPCPGWFGFRFRAGGEEVYGQGLAGFGQGLKGIGQEAVLEIPLGRGHEAIDHFRFQLDLHFVHEANKAGKFPAGLEEQFEVFAGLGAPDDTEDQFQDKIEFAEQTLVQAVLKPFLGLGHFLLQVLLMAVQGRGTEAVFLAEGSSVAPVRRARSMSLV